MREQIHKKNLELLNKYKMLMMQKGCTARSIESYCKYIIPMFLRFIGNKKLNKVTHHDIEDFIHYCAVEKQNGDAALDGKFIALNSFFKALIKKDYLDMKNPMDKIDPIKVRKKVREYLTDEEVEKIQSYADKTGNLRGSALIALLYSSAIRLTECYMLNRDSINFERRQFKVKGKGDKERICMISVDAAKRLQAYLKSRTDTNKALFYSRNHNRWSKKQIQMYLASAGVAAGIEKHVHPHIFRHARAMSLLNKGVPLEQIQQVLGHESVSTTQIYAHQSLNDIQSKIDTLDGVA
jgi:integrase/recombinase XerD